MKHLKIFSFCSMLLLGWACSNDAPKSEPALIEEAPKKTTPVISYSVVARYPHDKAMYTEGFLFHNGQLFESSGDVEYLPQTRSVIGSVDLKTGKVDIKAEIDKQKYFGEGIAFLNNRVYQLTYTTQIGFIYDAKTFRPLGQFGYQNKEGWGMTTEGKHLIFSDGTCNLTYMDPETFKVKKELAVTENGYALFALNELEYIKGYIYANVWTTNRIVKIDPSSGEVIGALDLTPLFNESKTRDPRLNETNGIAYDSVSDKVLVTGKLWPDIYEISFKH